MTTFEPCPVCGGTVNDDFRTDYDRKGWKDVMLTCNEDGNLKVPCWFRVSATVDTNARISHPVVQSILVDTWNKLSLHYREMQKK